MVHVFVWHSLHRAMLHSFVWHSLHNIILDSETFTYFERHFPPEIHTSLPFSPSDFVSESRGIGHCGEASSTVKSKCLFPPRVRQKARWMTKRTSQEPREGHKMAAQWDVFFSSSRWRARDAHAHSGARADVCAVIGQLLWREVSSGSLPRAPYLLVFSR